MPIFLKFKASLDDSAFMAGIRRITTASGRLGRGIGGAGRGIGGIGGGFLGGIGAKTFAAAGIGMGARAIMRDADALFNLSRKTGMTTRSLAALAEMGAGANVEMEGLAQSAAMMSNNLGTTKGQKAIKEIGLSLEELQTLKPEDQFAKIGKAIALIDDQSKKVGAARSIFGRGGPDLFELFDDLGTMDMSRISSNAQMMGDSAKTIADASDSLAKAGFRLKAGGAQLMKDLLTGDILGKLKNAILQPQSLLEEIKSPKIEAGKPEARDPFAGFTTANKTPSLAFRHLKDKQQWWNNQGGEILRSNVPGSKMAFGATGLRTGGLEPSLGLSPSGELGGVHSVVRRGDRKRAQARERMIDRELKEALERKKLLEDIKAKMEEATEILEENFG